MTVLRGARHLGAKHIAETRPGLEVVLPLRDSERLVQLLHEVVERLAFFERSNGCDADRTRYQALRIWPEPQQPPERVDVDIRRALGMECELRLGQDDVR